MATKSVNSISDQLTVAHLRIDNSLKTPEILAAVAEYGFTEARLQEGLALHTAAVNAVHESVSGRGTQRNRTAELNAMRQEAQDAYQAAAKLARKLLSPGDQTILGLDKPMPLDTAGFITAGYTLFDNASSSGLLASVGYTTEKCKAERDKIEAFDQANHEQEAAKGTAQQATQDQEAALSALSQWLAGYTVIAQVALRKKKQLLEKIGIKARATKPAARRAAPKKAATTRAAKKKK